MTDQTEQSEQTEAADPSAADNDSSSDSSDSNRTDSGSHRAQSHRSHSQRDDGREAQEQVLRHLPSIDKLLHDSDVQSLTDSFGRELVRDGLRVALEAARQWIRNGGEAPSFRALVSAAETWLRTNHTPSLRPVINATGVIIHTNLGRAPLAESAQQAMLAIASGYSTLEYQLDEGKRGKRDQHAESLLIGVTGAEAALAVNNNAAAITLILTALAKDKEVLLSRGELVEIGGGFRMPDVMRQSGARLIEVGTTNRTHVEDFRTALSLQTAMLLRVHASNFKIIGFTEQPPLEDLAALAHQSDVIAADDLGSGALLDTADYGLAHEPTVQESLRAGFDLVTFSGDKLLGGPQAGIIVGRADLISKLKRHPLTRTLRIDKLSLAALVATLDHYRRGDAVKKIPVWQMIAAHPADLRERAEAWAAELGGEVIETQSAIGGGSLPGETLPTFALALNPPQPDTFAAQLRRATMPVIARIEDDRVILDPRTVMPGQDATLVASVRSVIGHQE